MEVLTNIPFEIETKDLMTRLRLAPNSEDAEAASELLEWARSVAEPKAVCDACYVEDKKADSVVIGGVRFTSRVLSVNLAEAHRVFPCIATCGTELEAVPETFTDFMVPYWLDQIKEMALEQACRFVKTHIESKYRPGRLSSMAPGSLKDWPITQQKALFSLFGDVEEEIGVRLTESFLMFPVKSTSMLFFPTETSFESCQLCPRPDCVGRRAPYDEALWKRYRQDGAK